MRRHCRWWALQAHVMCGHLPVSVAWQLLEADCRGLSAADRDDLCSCKCPGCKRCYSLALRRQALSSSTLNLNVLFVSSLPVVTLHLQNSLSLPLRNEVPAGGVCNGTLRHSMQLLPATVAIATNSKSRY